MQPNAMSLANVGDLVERVDGAGVHSASASDRGDGSMSGFDILSDQRVKRVGKHSLRPIAFDNSQILAANSQELDRLLMAAMPFARLVKNQLRRCSDRRRR